MDLHSLESPYSILHTPYSYMHMAWAWGMEDSSP